jgi:diguanylate cyclase (GGDEF)-like protein
MRNFSVPTIGVLFGFHIYEGARPAPFSFPIISGMQAAARDKGIRLMLSCGVAHRVGHSTQTPAWPEEGPGTDFLPVGPWNTDGLLFTTPMLSKRRLHYARSLVDEGFPLLFIGRDSGEPAIFIDNQGGIRQAMNHLNEHGHREIAFIAGYEKDAGDSFSRLHSYNECVREYGLEDDPRLVEYGDHWDAGGYRAMKRILQSGVAFTAVMCSNDHSAMGAIRALREAGRRVPQDVAVAGFDDVPECLAQIPPLTSVHYPLFETGYRAVLLLQKRIEQGPGMLPAVTRVNTWLAPRQSCGCLPEVVKQSAAGEGSSQSPKELTQSVVNELQVQNPLLGGDALLPLCTQLVEDFLRSLEDDNTSRFQSCITVLVRRIESDGKNSAHIWQSAVSVLRRAAYAMLPADGKLERTRHLENLLHQARVQLSESVERRYAQLQVRRAGIDERMGMLTARLISSSDRERMYETLREDLPRVGVRTCHIVFFEPHGDDPVAGSVLKPLEPGAEEVRFETRRFPPPGIYPEGEPFNLALLPLTYQEEKMGYVAFDGGNLDPLATLVRQLASSIKNAELHAKVLDLSLTDGLTGVHNRRYFEIMLQKETDRSRRYQRDLAVIMIDIDRFKLYNDAYGHPAGDEALKEIVQCIMRGARRGLDVVTRYGGEEFAVILPETDVEGARVVAESMRRKVAEDGNLLQPTTVSLGIASLRGEKVSPEELVDEADRALYQAKAQGRNRTVVFYEEWMTEAANGEPPAGKSAGAKPRKKKSSRRKS